MKRNREADELLEWATLVLPWLSPADLTAAASACKSFRQTAIAVSFRRSSDASGGLERRPIPFLNSIDSQPYSYFTYAPSPILSPPLRRSWGGSRPSNPLPLPSLPSDFAAGCLAGCDCDERCPCSAPMMRECGGSCGCRLECGNRSTQRGVSVRLKIMKDSKKGWGLHAAEAVQRGEFVCEYAGEYLTTEDARRRQRTYDELSSRGRLSPALLIVREHLPSGKLCMRMNIDATKVGNVARFINHSCDGGNLSASLVRNSGCLLPRLCFFAALDIVEGEELTFSYGDTGTTKKSMPCFCGCSVCSGVLPSEET